MYLLRPSYGENGLPDADSLRALFDTVHGLVVSGKVSALYTPGFGGTAEAVMKMAFGNRIGFAFADVEKTTLFGYAYGSFVMEMADDTVPADAIFLGKTSADYALSYAGETVSLAALYEDYAGRLESVYPTKANVSRTDNTVPTISAPRYTTVRTTEKFARPRVLIPAFPGTNCEYDTAKALERAGLVPEIMVIRNLTSEAVAASVEAFAEKLPQSQIVFIPGGFSGGDEPDGSGKFITAFFRNGIIRERTNELLKARMGLMCGICNGFQAIVKLGLVPFGEIVDTDENCPTLTFNEIGRHQSRLVRTRIASTKSPWLAETEVGEIYNVAISHGEGRFIAPQPVLDSLVANNVGVIGLALVILRARRDTEVCFHFAQTDDHLEIRDPEQTSVFLKHLGRQKMVALAAVLMVVQGDLLIVHEFGNILKDRVDALVALQVEVRQVVFVLVDQVVAEGDEHRGRVFVLGQVRDRVRGVVIAVAVEVDGCVFAELFIGIEIPVVLRNILIRAFHTEIVQYL